MNAAYFVIFGAFLHFAGTVAYLRNTFIGRTKPNRVTFALWAAVPFISFGVGLSQGWTWALLPIFMGGFDPLLIFFASFVNPNAYWKLHTLDYLCGFFGVLAIIVWFFQKDPIMAVVLALIADALPLLPTLLKSWKYPETETGFGYLLAFFNGVFGLFVLSSAVLSERIWIYWIIACNLSVIIAVYRHAPLQKLKAEFAR